MIKSMQPATINKGENPGLEPVIELRHVAKQFGSADALRDVNMRVPRGSVYGLLGRNGAGKSTLMHMLLGILPPTSGEMSVLGLDPVRQGVELRSRIGYIPEHLQMYGWMTVKQTLRFVAGHYAQWSRTEEDRLVALFHVPVEKRVRELSHGNVALLSLVLAMAHNPEIVLLDECTSGMDVIARTEFARSVIDTLHDSERTVLFASHQIRELEMVCDWVGILKDGAILMELPVEDLKQSVKMLRVRASEAGAPVAAFPGEVNRQRIGRDWMITVRDYKPNLLSTAPAPILETMDLELEEIFVALLKQGGEEE